VNAAGNWYIVGVNDENIGGQITSITTATSAGAPYFAGAQYYTVDVAPAPFVDFTVNPLTTSYDFAYSDFEQPTVNVNTASIGTTTNWASLEVISGSEFDMNLEYRIDQQL
jgi:hypothetical protein